jgi:hypothetical protein
MDDFPRKKRTLPTKWMNFHKIGKICPNKKEEFAPLIEKTF